MPFVFPESSSDYLEKKSESKCKLIQGGEPILSASVIASGDILDGYRLIRPIGRGGFGEVWLSQLEATGEFRALKFIPSLDPEKLERELEAVKRYRSVASNLHSPHLLQIEHVTKAESKRFRCKEDATNGIGFDHWCRRWGVEAVGSGGIDDP